MRRAFLLVLAASCAPANDDTADAGSNFELCNDLSIADCDVVGCSRVRGTLEDDYCGDRSDERIPVACMPTQDTCGESVECAVRPEDGARFTFFSSCTPRGWQPCTLCDDFEFCETDESDFDVCVDEGASCDAFLVEWNDRFLDVVDAANTCATDLDCTTEAVNFLCGTGEVFVQGCVVPIAHDLACEYRQAIQDLEAELCTARCVPDECGLVAACPGPSPVACVQGRCAFAP